MRHDHQEITILFVLVSLLLCAGLGMRTELTSQIDTLQTKVTQLESKSDVTSSGLINNMKSTCVVVPGAEDDDKYGFGSGIVIRTHLGNAYVLTCAHVVRERGLDVKAPFIMPMAAFRLRVFSPEQSITVTAVDCDENGTNWLSKRTSRANVVAYHPLDDLAVLYVHDPTIFDHGAVLSEGDLVPIDTPIYAVGSPQMRDIYRNVVGHGMQSKTGLKVGKFLSDRDLANIVGIPGMSGCGIYSKKTGLCLGLLSAVLTGGPLTEYVPTRVIRDALSRDGLGYLLANDDVFAPAFMTTRWAGSIIGISIATEGQQCPK